MIQRYRSLPQFLYRQAVDALQGKRRGASIGIIGGADGPTAVFTTVRRRPRGRNRHGRDNRENGSLLFAPDGEEIRVALGVVLTIVLLVAGLSGYLYRRSLRRPLRF